MEELPKKTLQFTIDSELKKHERDFSKDLGNKILPKYTKEKEHLLVDLNIKKWEMVDINETQELDWNSFYHEFQFKSFNLELLRPLNSYILKIYPHREEGFIYIYRIDGQDKLWLTLLNTKTMIIRSDSIIPISFSIHNFIKIKARETMLVVISTDFIIVFRIEKETRSIELFKWPNTKMNPRLININNKYICLGVPDSQDPHIITIKIWNSNNRELLCCLPRTDFYQCWFIEDKFFILLWDQVTWTLNVCDLSTLSKEFYTILAKKSYKPQMGKSIRLCLPYLIILVSNPENCYLFFNCDTFQPEFYLYPSKYNIKKIYFINGKFIATTFAGSLLLLRFDFQKYKLNFEMFDINFRDSSYRDQGVNFTSHKLLGKIYSNNRTIGGVFWIPPHILFHFVDIYHNDTIYLLNKPSPFNTSATQLISKIWDTKKTLKEFENEDLSLIYKLYRIFNLDNYQQMHRANLTISFSNLLYPISICPEILVKIRSTLNKFPLNLDTKMLRNKEFCVQVIQAIYRLSLQPLSFNEERCIGKAIIILFERLNEIFELSKFELNPRRWKLRIKDYIIEITLIDDEIKMITLDSFRKKWDQFLSIYQAYFVSSYEAFLYNKLTKILKKKNLDTIASLKKFKTYQISLYNLDGGIYHGNIYSSTACVIFEKQYNELRNQLEDKDASLDLLYFYKKSSIDNRKPETKSQKNLKKSSTRDEIPFQNLEKELDPSFGRTLLENTDLYAEFNKKDKDNLRCRKCQLLYCVLNKFNDTIPSTMPIELLQSALIDLGNTETHAFIHFCEKNHSGKHMASMKNLIQNQFKNLRKELDDKIILIVQINSILSEYELELQTIKNINIPDRRVGTRLDTIKAEIVKYSSTDLYRCSEMINQIEILMEKVDRAVYDHLSYNDNIQYDYNSDWDDAEKESDSVYCSGDDSEKDSDSVYCSDWEDSKEEIVSDIEQGE